MPANSDSERISNRPRAVLVGIQLQEVTDEEHAAHLAELTRLVHTLGYQTVSTMTQKRAGVSSGTVLGSGKLQELARLTGGSGVVASGAIDRTSKAKE
jgi:GTP-binding protein HflX